MSLIEGLAAATLLAVGMAGILSGWGAVTGVVEHQRRVGEGMNLCRTHLERILSMPAGSPVLTNSTYGPFQETAFGVAVAGGPYRVTGEILPDRPSTGFVEVVIKTTWTESRGEFSTTLSTFREQ